VSLAPGSIVKEEISEYTTLEAWKQTMSKFVFIRMNMRMTIGKQIMVTE
jgi:hypothetical protein